MSSRKHSVMQLKHRCYFLVVCIAIHLENNVGKAVSLLSDKYERVRTISKQLQSTTSFGMGFTNVDSYVISTFIGVTLEDCIWECSLRPRCTGLEYRTLLKLCKLVWNSTTTERRAAFIKISGFETLPTEQCGSETCSEHETCSTATGLPLCKATECGYPRDVEPSMGNLYETGSTIFQHYNYGLRQLTCGQDGEWEFGATFPYPGVACGDIRDYRNDVTSGIFINKLDITVYCEWDDENSWLVFQRRQDGSQNFDRPWSDYKNGFGDLNGEFWLGLENLYNILSSPGGTFTLRVDLQDWSDITESATYSFFSITSEEDNYRLTVSGFDGTNDVSNSLISGSGMAFTTYDRDNDLAADVNCADYYNGGWWHIACVYATLNGQYFQSGVNNIAGAGIIWQPWRPSSYSLKATAMKIQRN